MDIKQEFSIRKLYSIENEKLVLGYFSSGEPFEPLGWGVQESDFFVPEHKALWKVIANAGDRSIPITPDYLVLHYCNASYLGEVLGKACSKELVPRYVSLLKRDRSRREAVELAQSAIHQAENDPDFFDGIGNGLPPIMSGTEFEEAHLKKPDSLIYGLLARGSKMVLSGGSKSFKTWFLMQLGHCIASGQDFITGATAPGTVLFINFEIEKYFFKERCRAMRQAMGISHSLDNFHVWNLRGHAADLESLEAKILQRVQQGTYACIIFDPLYKMLGDRDENSSGDMNIMMNCLERIAVKANAAIVFGTHHSKGNQAHKDAKDRASGSGVFIRDPDAALDLTRHEKDNHFTCTITLRNEAPIAPFVVARRHPLMIRTDDDPKLLHQPSKG